jgi:PleD family two-component response regulator
VLDAVILFLQKEFHNMPASVHSSYLIMHNHSLLLPKIYNESQRLLCEEAMNQPNPTILIVDDAFDNIEILSEALSSEFDILFAASGPEALDIASSQIPDLILLDIIMPEMDGYAVCKRLKADPKTKHIPIIFITAMTQVEDETKGLKLGALDYITKPISPPIVLARVRTQIERKRAEEEREKLIVELQEAFSRIKTLSGMLPICASCKKIRDDRGYWTQIELYFREHSEVEFSHGLCPECIKRLYPEI